MKKKLNKLLSKLGLNNNCPTCGKKMIPQGYYQERYFCKHCKKKTITWEGTNYKFCAKCLKEKKK